jgi:hypothetical protein
MASVNLETGKISGCKKGTKTYFHEVGHLKFEGEHRFGVQLRSAQGMSLRILLFAVGLYCIYPLWIMKLVILAGILTSILSEMWEEMWCWEYAKLQIKLKVINEDKKTKKG